MQVRPSWTQTGTGALQEGGWHSMGNETVVLEQPGPTQVWSWSWSTLFQRPWLPVVVCLALNAAVFFAVWTGHPEYLRESKQNENPDARHYVILGRNWWLLGEYSRLEQPPFTPDYFRTPVYPLFAGGLDILFGAGGIYVAHALLHTISCFLLFLLVAPFFGNRAAFWASLLLATDLVIVVGNFEAMSEMLFLFLVLASCCCLIPSILSQPTSGSGWRLAIGGILLGLATLARPAGLYLPFLFALLLAFTGWRRGHLLRHAALAGLLLLTALAPVGAWIARNWAVFSVPRLTHNDAIMLVYFTGGGAYQIEHGLTLEQAQKQISKEYNLPPPEVTNNPWLTDLPIAEMDAQLRAAVKPILLRYPGSLFISSLRGTFKASFSHNVLLLGEVIGDPWNPPGFSSLLRGEAESLRRLQQNSPLLILAFFWELIHAIGSWMLALIGLYLALRAQQTRPFGLALLMVLFYFHLTVAMVGADAFFRSRTPHMPYLFALAGLTLATWSKRIALSR